MPTHTEHNVDRTSSAEERNILL